MPNASDPRLNGNPPGAEIGVLATMLLSGGDRYAALPQVLALGGAPRRDRGDRPATRDDPPTGDARGARVRGSAARRDPGADDLQRPRRRELPRRVRVRALRTDAARSRPARALPRSGADDEAHDADHAAPARPRRARRLAAAALPGARRRGACRAAARGSVVPRQPRRDRRRRRRARGAHEPETGALAPRGDADDSALPVLVRRLLRVARHRRLHAVRRRRDRRARDRRVGRPFPRAPSRRGARRDRRGRGDRAPARPDRARTRSSPRLVQGLARPRPGGHRARRRVVAAPGRLGRRPLLVRAGRRGAARGRDRIRAARRRSAPAASGRRGPGVRAVRLYARLLAPRPVGSLARAVHDRRRRVRGRGLGAGARAALGRLGCCCDDRRRPPPVAPRDVHEAVERAVRVRRTTGRRSGSTPGMWCSTRFRERRASAALPPSSAGNAGWSPLLRARTTSSTSSSAMGSGTG